jgi:hypothetical protein
MTFADFELMVWAQGAAYVTLPDDDSGVDIEIKKAALCRAACEEN